MNHVIGSFNGTEYILHDTLRKWYLFFSFEKRSSFCSGSIHIVHGRGAPFPHPNLSAEILLHLFFYGVMYQSNGSFNVPLGHTPGIWRLFLPGRQGIGWPLIGGEEFDR